MLDQIKKKKKKKFTENLSHFSNQQILETKNSRAITLLLFYSLPQFLSGRIKEEEEEEEEEKEEEESGKKERGRKLWSIFSARHPLSDKRRL